MILNEFFNLPQVFEKDMNEFDASGYDRYSIYMDDYDLKEKFSDLDDAVEAIEAYKRDDPKSRYADYNVRDLVGKVVWRNDAWQDVAKPGKIQFLPRNDQGVAEGMFGSRPNPVLPIVAKIDRVARELNPQNVETGKQIIQSHTRDITRMLSPQARSGVDVIEQDELDEVDRRGFLKGMGAAAVAGAGISKTNNANAWDTKVIENMLQLYYICKDPDAISNNPEIKKPLCDKVQSSIKKFASRNDVGPMGKSSGKMILNSWYPKVKNDLDTLKYDELTPEQHFYGKLIGMRVRESNKIISDFNSMMEFNESVSQGVAEGVDIGQEWMSDTELDQYVPDRLQQQWRELLGYDQNGNPSALWVNLTGGYEPDVRDPEHRALMVKVANKWFTAKKIPNVKFFNVKDADDELEWLVQIGQQGVAEGKDDYVPPKEANYDDKYQAMVRRVGEKAKRQEKARQQQPPKTPVRENRRELLKQIIQS